MAYMRCLFQDCPDYKPDMKRKFHSHTGIEFSRAAPLATDSVCHSPPFHHSYQADDLTDMVRIIDQLTKHASATGCASLLM